MLKKNVKGWTFLCLTFSRRIKEHIKKFIRHHEVGVRSSLGVDVCINPALSLSLSHSFPGIVIGHTRSCSDAWWEQTARPEQTELIDPAGSFSAWHELFTYLASAFGWDVSSHIETRVQTLALFISQFKYVSQAAENADSSHFRV